MKNLKEEIAKLSKKQLSEVINLLDNMNLFIWNITHDKYKHLIDGVLKELLKTKRILDKRNIELSKTKINKRFNRILKLK